LIGRRGVLAGAALTGVAAAAAAPSIRRWIDAAKRGDGFRTLSADEAAQLGHLGEALVPGAHAAGIAHYVDHHLSVPSAESLLMLRYLDIAPPYADFYRSGLAQLARSAGGRVEDWTAIAGSLAAGTITPWDDAPPAALFYFVLRADAVDVVYGTEAGFERLGVPYLPHIPPGARW